MDTKILNEARSALCGIVRDTKQSGTCVTVLSYLAIAEAINNLAEAVDTRQVEKDKTKKMNSYKYRSYDHNTIDDKFLDYARKLPWYYPEFDQQYKNGTYATAVPRRIVEEAEEAHFAEMIAKGEARRE